MSTGEKIKTLRIALGMSQEELGEKIGVQKAAIHKYENDIVVNLKKSVICALAIALKCSPAYLMFDDKSQLPTMKKLKRILSAEEFEQVEETAALWAQHLDEKGEVPWSVMLGEVPLDIKNAYRVPVLGRIPAGNPLDAIEEIEDYEEIPADWVAGGKEYFALKIRGNSMEPKYLDGDTVIFLKAQDCDSGAECAVIINGEDATFKKVRKGQGGIIVQPLNPSYDPIHYTNRQIEELPVRIIGIAKRILRDT